MKRDASKDGITRGADGVMRCWWPGDHEDYCAYHDKEWGRPVADDQRLFEKICLEGFQSGLSWLTILRKRENFRSTFRDFDIDAVARFDSRSVERILKDAGIVRHRGKIESTINNARCARKLRAEFGSLAAYFWQFEPKEGSRPQRITRVSLSELTKSAESTALSVDLKRRGWSFVGPTTLYAFMQSMGLVNDHLHRCEIRSQVESARDGFVRPSSEEPSALEVGSSLADR